MTVSVLVAEDHTMVREGLVRALEQAGFDVVGQVGDGEQAVTEAVAQRPDVVLMDLSLPVLSGTAATRRIRYLAPASAVLVLTMLSDEAAVASALAAGAAGYMVKDCTTAELLDAVERVAAGEVVLSASADPGGLVADGGGVGEALGGRLRHQPCGAREDGWTGETGALLSRREEEVLRLMSTGVSIGEAAAGLFISVKTVKNHLSSIYRKLDCHDRAQAVLKAIRLGLVQVD